MLYLSAEYQLSQVTEQEYRSAARSVAISKKLNSIASALKLALKHEDPGLAQIIAANAVNLHESYGNGGGMYTFALAASVKALRQQNPDVPPIGLDRWDEAIEREQELRDRPAIGTIEMLSGIGLAEITSVNPGYIDGFQASFHRPGFASVSGVIGLAGLHAHDLMHFTSQG
jgi:hypothetical protein